jgi:hypothetical protein
MWVGVVGVGGGRSIPGLWRNRRVLPDRAYGETPTEPHHPHHRPPGWRKSWAAERGEGRGNHQP